MTAQGVRVKNGDHAALVARLKEVMRLRNWSASFWSKEAGCSRDAIRNIMRSRSEAPRIDTLDRLAKYAGCSVEWLRGRTDVAAPTEEEARTEAAARGRLPLIGYIGAGDVVHHFGIGDSRETVPAPPDIVRGVAAQVRGISMLPVYRDGDLVIGREHEGTVDQLVGHDCFVQVHGGALYLKILRKGAKGAFHLDSYNPSNPRIENQAVEWAAPVAWVKRS